MTLACRNVPTSRRVAAPLVLVALGLVSAGCSKEERESPETTTEALTATRTGTFAQAEHLAADRVDVYYFHGNRRCKTCKAIQRAIQTTIDKRFDSELASGALAFHEVNIDDPENAHFVEEYELSSSSMVVVEKKDDKKVSWENCSKVWPLAHQEAELARYVHDRIASHLGSATPSN